MSIALIIPCNNRDQRLIPLVVASIRSVGIKASIFVAPCHKNPPVTILPMTSPIKWFTHEVVTSTLEAMLFTEADKIIKVDSDILFLKRPKWLESKAALCGYTGQMGNYILGGCYSLTRTSVEAMLQITDQARPTQLEDVGLSRLANTLGLTKSVCSGGIKSWLEVSSLQVDAVHVGEDWPRGLTYELYKALFSSLHPFNDF